MKNVSFMILFLFSDATIRFLKAKLRVMQEELENVATECRQKVHTANTTVSFPKVSGKSRSILLMMRNFY